MVLDHRFGQRIDLQADVQVLRLDLHGLLAEGKIAMDHHLTIIALIDLRGLNDDDLALVRILLLLPL